MQPLPRQQRVKPARSVAPSAPEEYPFITLECVFGRPDRYEFKNRVLRDPLWIYQPNSGAGKVREALLRIMAVIAAGLTAAPVATTDG